MNNSFVLQNSQKSGEIKIILEIGVQYFEVSKLSSWW